LPLIFFLLLLSSLSKLSNEQICVKREWANGLDAVINTRLMSIFAQWLLAESLAECVTEGLWEDPLTFRTKTCPVVVLLAKKKLLQILTERNGNFHFFVERNEKHSCRKKG